MNRRTCGVTFFCPFNCASALAKREKERKSVKSVTERRLKQLYNSVKRQTECQQQAGQTRLLLLDLAKPKTQKILCFSLIQLSRQQT